MKDGGFSASTGRPLDLAYWDSRHRSGATSWDIGEVSPPIKSYIHQIKDKDIAILIPGSGSSYEAEFLSNLGFKNITVLDISPTLVQKLKKRFKDKPEISVIQGDFFDFKGSYNLIFEQTFFCAIPPYRRQDYAKKMHELLVPNGQLVGVLFNRTFEDAGPPFGGAIDEYENLFSQWFKIKTLKPCHNSHPARAGSEVFINFIKSDS